MPPMHSVMKEDEQRNLVGQASVSTKQSVTTLASDQLCASENRDVAAKVDSLAPLPNACHQMQERVRGIIQLQKFAPRGAITANYQFDSACDLGFMSLAHGRGNHVAGSGIEIVPLAIKTGGHRRNQIASDADRTSSRFITHRRIKSKSRGPFGDAASY